MHRTHRYSRARPEARSGQTPLWLLVGLAMLVAGFAWTPADAREDATPAIAFAARLVGDEERARLIVDFDRALDHEISLAQDPLRVVVELPSTVFRLPEAIVRPSAKLIAGLRYGVAGVERSSIVLELSGPAKVVFSSFSALDGEGRHRLIVDLKAIDPPEFTSLLEAQRVQDAEVPTVASPAPPSPRTLRRRIVLDPGHGGVDGGARGRGRTSEKDVTLAFARTLAARLRAAGHEVLMTRDADTFVSLRQRLAFIESSNADLAVSLHADSLRQRSIRGATVYTLSRKGSDALARSLAREQNRADLLEGFDVPKEDVVTDILVDLIRRETEVLSDRFAGEVVRTLRPTTRLIGNPKRAANFHVLRAPQVPSVLLELGYLSNSRDEALLASPSWRDEVADAVAKAIGSYLNGLPRGAVANESRKAG